MTSTPPPGFQPVPGFPPPAPQKKKRWPLVLMVGISLLVVLCIGGTFAAFSSDDGKIPTAGPTSPGAYEDTPSPTPTEKDKLVESQKTPAAPTKPAAPPKPAPVTVDDGVWVVGEDIPAGTYRVTESVAGMDCYWAIHKSGTNGENIISNDLPSGGFPRVTLKKGQDFESNRCGTWQKIR